MASSCTIQKVAPPRITPSEWTCVCTCFCIPSHLTAVCGTLNGPISVDIWRFTTYWTLIFIVSIYTMAGIWACLVFSRRHYKWAIFLPVLFFLTGAFIAFLSGSLVGKNWILQGEMLQGSNQWNNESLYRRW